MECCIAIFELGSVRKEDGPPGRKDKRWLMEKIGTKRLGTRGGG